jgi:hypothetical protein
VKTAAPASSASAAPSYTAEREDDVGGLGAVWAMLAAIALLFLLAYFLRNMQSTTTAGAALPAVSNTVFATCPAGTVPRDLLDPALLEPSGGIVNDTQE